MKPDCPNCPIGCSDKVLVGGEGPRDAPLVIISDYLGNAEIREKRPMMGQAGHLLGRALKRHKISRERHCYITNALACKPGRKLKPAEWKQAIACCYPRLERELDLLENPKCIVLAGGKALQAITGKAIVKDWMGALLDSSWGPVLPIFNPAACLRKPALIPIFKTLMGRAWGICNGLKPDDFGEFFVEPGPKMLRALKQLLDDGKPLGVDVETAGVEPLEDDLLCIGIANEDIAVSVPYPLPDRGHERLTRKVLSSPLEKVMQNGQHDVLSLEAHDIEVSAFTFDTMLAHATYASQLPHDLGFITATELFLPRWKTEYRVTSDLKGSEAFASRPIRELQTYNCGDAQGTVRLKKRQDAKINVTHRGRELFNEYMELNEIAMKMRKRGVKVSRARLLKQRKELTKRIRRAYAQVKDVVGDKYKIGKSGQHKDLKTLFFQDLGITPIRYSPETGAPRLDKLTLQDIIAQQNGVASHLAKCLLDFRKDVKLRSTYIDGLHYDKKRVVHITWKPQGTITGRWSSARPNGQNIPASMREMFVARRGKVIISADYSQLELRIIAYLSQDPLLLEWLENGEDVHARNVKILFDIDLDTIADKDKHKKIRNLGKRLCYGFNYLGQPEEVWRQCVVDYPDLQLRVVRKAYRSYFQEHRSIKEFQDSVLRQARTDLFVEETLSGRREVFHDGIIDPNKAINFAIQGGAGTIMNKGIKKVDAALDWDSGESILFQVHDQIDIEVAERDLDRGISILRECMGSKEYPVDVSYGKDWKNLEDVK